MSWFSKKAPKALVAGMHLTRNDAQILIRACQELESFMNRQAEEIKAFQKTDRSEARRALESIQERHHRIDRRLDDLALRLRNNHPKESLRKELEAATRSMSRKHLRYKCASKPSKMGWEAAAQRYWPRIAESYATLLQVLGNFRQDLENGVTDDTLWSKEAQKRNRRSNLKSLKLALKCSPRIESELKSEGKHVVFNETVCCKNFSSIDAPNEAGKTQPDTEWLYYGWNNDFIMKLATDRKRSTKRFHERAYEKRVDARSVARFRERRRQAEAGERGQEATGAISPEEVVPSVEVASPVQVGRIEAEHCYLDDVQEARSFVPL